MDDSVQLALLVARVAGGRAQTRVWRVGQTVVYPSDAEGLTAGKRASALRIGAVISDGAGPTPPPCCPAFPKRAVLGAASAVPPARTQPLTARIPTRAPESTPLLWIFIKLPSFPPAAPSTRRTAHRC